MDWKCNRQSIRVDRFRLQWNQYKVHQVLIYLYDYVTYYIIFYSNDDRMMATYVVFNYLLYSIIYCIQLFIVQAVLYCIVFYHSMQYSIYSVLYNNVPSYRIGSYYMRLHDILLHDIALLYSIWYYVFWGHSHQT